MTLVSPERFRTPLHTKAITSDREESLRSLSKRISNKNREFFVQGCGTTLQLEEWINQASQNNDDADYGVNNTINPKTIDFCGPSANPGLFGTSKSKSIFNPLAITPIDVRYRRY
jgi:hypothetical protein